MSDRTPLPQILEYTGEFGPELTTFLPFIRWLVRTGQIGNRCVRTYKGMEPFYADLSLHKYEEKDVRREYVHPSERAAWMPVRNEHTFETFARPPEHDYGDMRHQFGRSPIPPELAKRAAEKPLLVIHNKFNAEWRDRPVNFIGLPTLDALFSRLKADFTLVYIRHGLGAKVRGFSEDHNLSSQFGDLAIVDSHPEVVEFERNLTLMNPLVNVNLAKMALYSRCYHFISVQGGGAAQIALFSGSLVAILHREGQEENWAYNEGYYGFMANPPPTLLLPASQADLRNCVPAIKRSRLENGWVILAERDRNLYPKSTINSRAVLARRLSQVRRRLSLA